MIVVGYLPSRSIAIKEFLPFWGAGLGDDIDGGHNINFLFSSLLFVADSFRIGLSGINWLFIDNLMRVAIIEGDLFIGGIGKCVIDVAKIDGPLMDGVYLLELNRSYCTLSSSDWP